VDTLKARLPGTCPICRSAISPGDPLGRWMQSWAHRPCVESWRQYESNQLAILRGETFASQKPSEWRRKPTQVTGGRRRQHTRGIRKIG
jgi:hypothetical protein